MTFPTIVLPYLPPNTVIPQDPNLFISYLNRLYEDIAFAVNYKDFIYFPMAITDTATSITNLPTFGSFIICVSGSSSGLPCLTASLCKASSSAIGVIDNIGFQAGTASPFAAATLTITSTSTNFQIAHSVVTSPVTTGNFNIRIIGTQ